MKCPIFSNVVSNEVFVWIKHKSQNLPCTLTRYSLSSSPAGLDARHVYLPVSSTYKTQTNKLYSVNILMLVMEVQIH